MPQESNESKADCRKATQEREGEGADGAKYGAGAGPQDRAATSSSTTAPGSGNRGHQKQQSSPHHTSDGLAGPWLSGTNQGLERRNASDTAAMNCISLALSLASSLRSDPA